MGDWQFDFFSVPVVLQGPRALGESASGFGYSGDHTHVQTDAPDGADFLSRKRAQNTLREGGLACFLARIQYRGARVDADLDGVLFLQAYVERRVDWLADLRRRSIARVGWNEAYES